MNRRGLRGTRLLLAIATIGAAGLAVVVARDGAQLAPFLGRFHPLLVHLPIGGLFVAAVLAAASKTTRFAYVRVALAPVLAFCAVSALLGAAAGQLLASDAAYVGGAFVWHRRLGYVVALVSVVAALVAGIESRRTGPRWTKASDVLIGVALALLLITGHLGGTLSRGPGYLTHYLPRTLGMFIPGWSGEPASTSSVLPQQVVTYTSLVAPILQERCVACHGPSNVSGGLRLDTPEHIGEGGESGPVIVAEQAARSELVRRIWLPVTHPDVMPPRERAPLTVAEASVLRWWIEQGASFDLTLADMQVTDDLLPAIEARVGTLRRYGPAVLSRNVPPLEAPILDGLAARGLPVSRLAEHAQFVQVQARGSGQSFGDAEVQALLPVAAQLTWLDLGGTAVTDAALEVVARFPHLSRLHLDRTAVTDAGLAHLGSLEYLEYLNLYGTSVTDAGVASLATLPRLRTLYLWQTAVTAEGIERLKAARPTLDVNAGHVPSADGGS